MSFRDDQAEELNAYADLLQANGFTIYVPKRSDRPDGPKITTYFRYSRTDAHGRELFGYVQAEYFGGFSHSMPIKPSLEYGSSMFVGKKGTAAEVLTVYAAHCVTQATNTNPVVGRQNNHAEDRTGLYVART